ncbi:MAG TPA: YlxR family protein [Amycolatopsis sp.]|nr:YlxR family protein [Amycolatopsis sp.]
MRTCVGCRQRASAGELLRVVARDGLLVADERRRLPGRGAWLHPDPDCLGKAERRRAFARALRVSGILDGGGLRRHLEAARQQASVT